MENFASYIHVCDARRVCNESLSRERMNEKRPKFRERWWARRPKDEKTECMHESHRLTLE